MKHAIRILMTAALLGLGASWAPLASAGAAPMDLDETAEAIRDGKIDVGKRYDMHKKRGRFHRIHSETLGLDCEACHVAKRYAPDYLLLDKANAEAKAQGQGKGPKADVLDRGVCLGCHKTNGVATTWYRTADQ